LQKRSLAAPDRSFDSTRAALETSAEALREEA